MLRSIYRQANFVHTLQVTLSVAVETSQRLDFFTVDVELRVLYTASVSFYGALDGTVFRLECE